MKGMLAMFTSLSCWHGSLRARSSLPLLLASAAVISCTSQPRTGAVNDAGVEVVLDAARPVSEAGPPLPAPDPVARVCTSDAWCWDGSGPHGNGLHAVAATSASDVWAVGELGLVLHHDGETWHSRWAPTREHLRAVHVGAGEVWAAGDDATLLLYANGAWQAITPSTLPPDADLRGLARDAEGNVWVVGTGGTLLERRDGVWSLVPTGLTTSFNAVWTRGEQVWVAGDGGVVLRRADDAWIAVDSGTSQNLIAIDGQADEIWIAGAGGEVRRYDAEATRFERPGGEGPAPSGSVTALEVSGRRVYAASQNGNVHLWDGDATCPVPGDAGAPEQPCPGWAPVRTTGQDSAVHGLWADGDDAIAVGTFGCIVSWQGPRRTVVAPAAMDNYLDISGSAAGAEVWVAGDRLLRRESGAWVSVDRDSPRAVYGVQALGSGQTLLAGTGGMSRRWSGESWDILDVSPDAWLHGVWSDGDVGWLVGSRGRAWGLLNRRVWTPLDTPTDRDLLAVWSAPSGEAWAVGEGGTVLRHDGSQWAPIPSGPNGGISADLRGVWGLDAHDIWAVGTAGTALHWDGDRWTPSTEPASFSLNAVWGRAPNDVWAVGSGGTILHYDGAAWQPEFSGTAQALHAVWGDASRVWAVGEHGALLLKELGPAAP